MHLICMVQYQTDGFCITGKMSKNKKKLHFKLAKDESYAFMLMAHRICFKIWIFLIILLLEAHIECLVNSPAPAVVILI